MGKENKHVRCQIVTDSGLLTGIIWNKADWFRENFVSQARYDLLYYCELNHFQDEVSVQLKIQQIELAV